MDAGRTIYRLTQLYVGGLFAAGLLTVGWLLVPELRESVRVAGLWFGLAGFGFLVAVTFFLLYVER